ncbi:uncharacterized protein VTP21DRAFT_10552 [Calcarisporiella thermophila]|uniref:uncharacterized protein n=1 Tax=Calcarisporiella thermophila TaxID=911321 RepID=UPI003742DA6C
MDWKPQEQGLAELLQLLRLAVSPSNEQQPEVQQKLDSFNKIPDYNNYLAYILTQMPQEEPSMRSIAGLVLKNNIRLHLSEMRQDVIEYIKTVCLQSIGDTDPAVRGTISIVVTNLVSRIGVANWPEVLNSLMALLDNTNLNVVEGALSTLQKICEDSTRDLDQEYNGVRPLNYMIPKFVSFFDSPNDRLRVLALRCVNQFIYTRSQSLNDNIDVYVSALFKRATDHSPEVRVQVCQALVGLIEVRPDKLAPEFNNVVEYMLYSTQDQEDEVALEACEFWLAIAEQEELREHLRPYLPRIIPVLLRGMVYSEMDLLNLGDDEDNANVPDREEDIKPRHHQSKERGTERPEEEGEAQQQQQVEDDEDDEDEDDDLYDEDEEDFEWTLRKCSAAALDVLATVFHNQLLEVLLPLLKDELFHQDWRHRECGILALGAVSEGCMDGIEPHLKDLVPYLIQSLNDAKPLVRSITCWTLGRYSRWCVAKAADPEGRQKYFEPLLEGLLRMVLDNNKRVQEAGCSAFATLEEEATKELIPYLDPILRNLVFAFNKYQQKNLLILYDAIGTLAESVGPALAKKEYIEMLMPPLIEKWNQVADDDTDLFPLLESLAAITAALGLGFQPFAPPVFDRCVKLVHSNLVQRQMYQQNPNIVNEPDMDFVTVALDLLSGLAQGLGTSIESLVAGSQLLQLLPPCFTDPVPDVRQSAFALLGDLAASCFAHLKPFLPQWLPIIISQIDPNGDQTSVCNNATWATGEIAIQWGPEIQPYVQPLLERLIPLLTNPQRPPTLLENAAITLGRLGLVVPQLVSPHLVVFFEHWCNALRPVRENDEKASAFRGMCTLIQANPEAVLKTPQGLNFLLEAVASWEQPSSELHEKMRGIVQGYKQMMAANWDGYAQRLPPALFQVLQERYGI